MKKLHKIQAENNSDIVMYETSDGLVKIDVNIKDENVWLNINQIAELFDRDRSVISKHIKNVFEEGELEEKSNVQNLPIANSDKPVSFFSLDVVISVGYRVKSKRGVQFRIWATKILKEYIKKGFALDDERLKNQGGGNYFRELLDRIRDIRSSEKAIYRQVLDLFATSVDYDKNSEECIKYFKIVQNKFHYAAHGHTAPEVIYERADSSKDFMGLRSFTGEMPKLKDIVIAKNYLDDKELKKLNNLVSGYFDFAENMALEERPVKMQDYIDYLNNLIKAGKDKLLTDSGSIKHDDAIKKAKSEYKKYQKKTLSQIEVDYIESLKEVSKRILKNMKNK